MDDDEPLPPGPVVTGAVPIDPVLQMGHMLTVLELSLWVEAVARQARRPRPRWGPGRGFLGP